MIYHSVEVFKWIRKLFLMRKLRNEKILHITWWLFNRDMKPKPALSVIHNAFSTKSYFFQPHKHIPHAARLWTYRLSTLLVIYIFRFKPTTTCVQFFFCVCALKKPTLMGHSFWSKGGCFAVHPDQCHPAGYRTERASTSAKHRSPEKINRRTCLTTTRHPTSNPPLS